MRYLFLIYLALAGSLSGATSTLFTFESGRPADTAISEEFIYSSSPSFYSDSFTFEFGFQDNKEDIDLINEGSSTVGSDENSTAINDGSSTVGSGWYKSDWFGYYFPTDLGWIFHSGLGWLYPNTKSLDSVWLFNPSLKNLDYTTGKWMWTNDIVFPFFYMKINHLEASYQLSPEYPWTWTYWSSKGSNASSFYDYSSNRWLDLGR